MRFNKSQSSIENISTATRYSVSFNKSQSSTENITEDPEKSVEDNLTPAHGGRRNTWSTLMDAGKNEGSPKGRGAKTRKARSRVYSLDNQRLITQLFKRRTEPDQEISNNCCVFTDQEIDGQDPNVQDRK